MIQSSRSPDLLRTGSKVCSMLLSTNLDHSFHARMVDKVSSHVDIPWNMEGDRHR